MRNPDGIVRVGGVGTGRIFNWAHTRVYPALVGKAFLTGFYDTSQARAEESRGKYAETLKKHAEEHPQTRDIVQANLAELRAYASLDEMLDRVDCVDICTHSRGRIPSALAALNKGVHSMLEKPMARTWIEADRAVRAFAARPDVFCQLNDDNVFDPKYRLLANLVSQGTIGKPQLMSLVRGSGLAQTSVLKSQANAFENGGGCMMDYGSHGMAGVWYALGLHLRPVKVETIRIGVRFRDRVLEGEPYVMEVDDDGHFKVLFEDPQSGSWVTVFMEATWSGGQIGLPEHKQDGRERQYLRIEGDEGVLDATPKEGVTVRRWNGGTEFHPLREYPDESISFASEIETFIDCIRANRPPEIDVKFGAEIIAIIGAAYLSAIRGEAVTLEEFKQFSRQFVDKYGDNEQAEEAVLHALLDRYKSSGR